MTDPRKPIVTPDPDDQQAVAQVFDMHLMACADNIAVDLGITGISAVVMGVGFWAADLSDVDRGTTAEMLRALADVIDPQTTADGRLAASRRRATAAARLLAAHDLATSQLSGRA